MPGAPYAPSASLIVHYPLPLAKSRESVVVGGGGVDGSVANGSDGAEARGAAAAEEEELLWSLDHGVIDSRGEPLLSGDGEILSVLSTM